MNIAIFNGFPFHYEMFGYIIHFCYINNFKLTIYTNFENQNGWFEFYSHVFNKKNYNFLYKNIDSFILNKNNYDLIILTTDDDNKFDTTDDKINNKTIRIDHNYNIRNLKINKFIATRPFSQNLRTWALPCYPLILKEKNNLLDNNFIKIAILGESLKNYNINIINRLYSSNKKIVIIGIARRINKSQFSGINKNINLLIYENINSFLMINILSTCNYILTDVSINKDYECENMSGAIPFSFSLLAPLIISYQTNKYYNFKNIIEFHKNSNDKIILNNINIDLFISERDELVNNFSKHIFNYLKLKKQI